MNIYDYGHEILFAIPESEFEKEVVSDNEDCEIMFYDKFDESGRFHTVRCHAHVDLDNPTVDFISRQGKKFTTLDKLKPAVLNFMSDIELGLKGKWVLDGEVCIMNGDKEDFQGLMSLVRRKDYTIENPRYKVFDILTEDEFYGRKESPNFSAK